MKEQHLSKNPPLKVHMMQFQVLLLLSCYKLILIDKIPEVAKTKVSKTYAALHTTWKQQRNQCLYRKGWVPWGRTGAPEFTADRILSSINSAHSLPEKWRQSSFIVGDSTAGLCAKFSDNARISRRWIWSQQPLTGCRWTCQTSDQRLRF